MKIPENSTESTTSSGRQPQGLDRGVRRRGNLDVNKRTLDMHLPTMRPLDKSPLFRALDPNRPFENWPAIRRPDMRPPIEPPFLPSFNNLPPTTSMDWPHVDHPDRFEVDFKMIDLKPYMPTPPPPHAPGFTVVRGLGSAVGGIVALLIIANVIRGKANRTRRGKVIGADAVQQGRLNTTTDQPSTPNYPRSPSEQGGRPLDNDLPPPYYECALSSIKKYVSEDPPPYTYFKDAEPQVNIQRQNALIENGHRAEAGAMTTTSNDSEDVAPEMRTELVFDNGRIVERLSLDLNCNNKESKLASNENIKQQSTRM